MKLLIYNLIHLIGFESLFISDRIQRDTELRTRLHAHGALSHMITSFGDQE